MPLTLRRYPGQSVVLTVPGGEPVTIEVIRGGASVVLSIDAPPEVEILRHELLPQVRYATPEAVRYTLPPEHPLDPRD